MKKKKKKQNGFGNWMGYCPFESRYNGLYHDTKARKASLARRTCHDTNFVSWLGAAVVTQ